MVSAAAVLLLRCTPPTLLKPGCIDTSSPPPTLPPWRDPTAGDRRDHGRCGRTHHVCQGNVQEHSSSYGKDYTRSKGASDHDPQDQADVARHGRQQVEENGLRDAHPGVQQDDEVSCRWSRAGLVMMAAKTGAGTNDGMDAA